VGAVKGYWFQVQEEERERWIREHLDDEDADEETERWDELANEYDMMLEAQEFEAEYQWFKKQCYSALHDIFINEIDKLKELFDTQVAIQHEQTIYKMIYAHSVTLLESFLSDTVKSLIIRKTEYFENAIRNVEDLKKSKFNLSEISTQTNGAVGLAVKTLSTILYHNIPKVSQILNSIVGCKLSLEIDRMGYITSVRHDIVHRNGRTTEGALIDIDKDTVKQAITDIEEFVDKLQIKLNELENV